MGHLFVYCRLCCKDENKEKEAGNGPFNKNNPANSFSEYLETNPCGSPASSYRQIVLDVVRPCLESSNSRLVTLGVGGLQESIL